MGLLYGGIDTLLRYSKNHFILNNKHSYITQNHILGRNILNVKREQVIKFMYRHNVRFIAKVLARPSPNIRKRDFCMSIRERN